MTVVGVATFLAKGAAAYLFTGIVSGLTRKDVETPVVDTKPATLAERNAPIAVIVGRERLAPVFLWEGNREVFQEALEGGGGGKGVGSSPSAGTNNVFRATGMHALCVGPATRLLKIRENGESIWPRAVDNLPAGITPFTHPSGSTLPVELTEEGKFRGEFTIYWGEADQPINPRVTDVDAFDVDTNFGQLCFVVWTNKRLGGAGVWPSLEYDVEVRPYNPAQDFATSPDPETLAAVLPGSEDWFTNALAEDPANEQAILDIDPVAGTIEFCADPFPAFGPAFKPFRIKGNEGGIDGDYEAIGAPTALPPQTGPTGPFVDQVLTGYDLNDGSEWISTGDSPSPFFVATGTPAGVTLGAGVTRAGWINASNPESGSLVKVSPDSVSGNSLEFGFFHRFTFYAYLRGSSTTAFGNLRFTCNPNGPGGGVVSLDSRTQAVSTSDPRWNSVNLTNLGGSWFRVVADYVPLVGDPSRTLDLTVSGTISNQFNPSGEAVGLVIGDGTGGSEPFYQRAPGVNCPNPVRYQVTGGDLTQGVDFTGTACPLVESPTAPQGANPAHIIYQLLFQPAPYGLGKDQNCYDIPSLEALGVTFETEGTRHHVGIDSGNTIESSLQVLLDETQSAVVWDATTGLWVFKAIRAEAPLATVPIEAIAPDLPEATRHFDQNTISDLEFEYSDGETNFRKDVIPIVNDTAPVQGIEVVPLRTVRDRESATQVAERKALVEHGRPSAQTLRILRNIDEARVGDVLDFGDHLGVNTGWRIMAMQREPDLAQTIVTVVTDPTAVDTLEARELGFDNNSPAEVATPFGAIENDLDLTLFELPGALLPDISFQVLRTPTQGIGQAALIQSSVDDLSYVTETARYSSLSASIVGGFPPGDFFVEDGPVLDDSEGLLDGNTAAFSDADAAVGRQWLILNDEILFVREFEAIGGSLLRAKGVYRARFESVQGAHADGDRAYVIFASDIQPLTVPTAGVSQDLYVKSLPQEGLTFQTTALALTEVVQPEGKAVRPLPLTGLRTADMTQSYIAGQGFEVRWEYSLHSGYEERTGAGMQNYGEVTGSGEGFDGSFIVLVADATLTTIYVQATVTDPTLTVLPGDIAAATTDLVVQVLPILSTGQAGERVQAAIERL